LRVREPSEFGGMRIRLYIYEKQWRLPWNVRLVVFHVFDGRSVGGETGSRRPRQLSAISYLRERRTVFSSTRR
jgi:hypothetical protein